MRLESHIRLLSSDFRHSRRDRSPVYVFTNGTETQKLTATDAAADAFFGNAISASGDFVVVLLPGLGMRLRVQEDERHGLADSFGISVDVSGSLVVVGAHSDSDRTGAAFLFRDFSESSTADVLACRIYGLELGVPDPNHDLRFSFGFVSIESIGMQCVQPRVGGCP